MNTGLTKTINNAPTSNTKNTASADGNGMIAAVNSYSQYLNDMYAAQREANLNALEAEYTSAIGELEREKAAIAPAYSEARRQTAGTNAMETRAMNEVFNANGLSSGGRAQGAIAQSNVLQNELGALQKAETAAIADIEARRTQLSAQYQAKVREAIMNNEMSKAMALYDEALRYDNELVAAQKDALAAEKEKAAMLASIGNFSGYANLGYSPEEIAALEAAYKAKQYKGSGGNTEDKLTNYFQRLSENSVVDEYNAQQLLYGMGVRGDELADITDGYMEYIKDHPPAVPITNKVVANTYDQYLKGNLDRTNTAESIVTHAENGTLDPNEAKYLLYQLGY